MNFVTFLSWAKILSYFLCLQSHLNICDFQILYLKVPHSQFLYAVLFSSCFTFLFVCFLSITSACWNICDAEIRFTQMHWAVYQLAERSVHFTSLPTAATLSLFKQLLLGTFCCCCLYPGLNSRPGVSRAGAYTAELPPASSSALPIIYRTHIVWVAGVTAEWYKSLTVGKGHSVSLPFRFANITVCFVFHKKF